MVRLSLIVLGLLVAAWCSTANGFLGKVGHGIGMRGGKVLYDKIDCNFGKVLSIGTCKKMTRPCSKPYFGWFSVQCISRGEHKRIKTLCDKKDICKIKAPMEKGPYNCQVKCIKA